MSSFLKTLKHVKTIVVINLKNFYIRSQSYRISIQITLLITVKCHLPTRRCRLRHNNDSLRYWRSCWWSRFRYFLLVLVSSTPKNIHNRKNNPANFSYNFSIPRWWFDRLTERSTLLNLLEVPSQRVASWSLNNTTWFAGYLRLFFLVLRTRISKD